MFALYMLLFLVIILIVLVGVLIFYVTRESREFTRKKRAVLMEEINQRHSELEKRKAGGGLAQFIEMASEEAKENSSDTKTPIGFKK